MSTSVVICHNLIFINNRLRSNSLFQPASSSLRGRKRFNRLIANSKNKKGHSRNRKWWQKFFFDDEGNWLGLRDDDLLVEDEAESSVEELSDKEKFEEWKKRAEAIVELREAQEDMRNEEGRRWEDWLVDESNSSWDIGGGSVQGGEDDVLKDSTDMIPEKGFVESVRDIVLGREDDDLLYEDRVFQYASLNSAKFVAVLIIVPWLLDFVVHDYVLMPFLDRYVKTVPLAAEALDIKRHQKLEIVKELKTEKARFRLEEDIGKSPPLTDDEVWVELRHKALELREERRLENRSEFANIWSDMVFGISLFVILYFNQSQVALLKFTGYKIVNNISDTGKAFLIILIADIFLGYHSESGWQTLVEIIVDHYGFGVDEASITIFVCIIPVILDACVKLWMFKFLPRLSPRVSNIFREMTRH